MPNHITNKVELSGKDADVKELISSLSTTFERTPNLTHDKRQIFTNEDGIYGWLNPITNEFERRDKETVIGVPEGFTQDFEEEWTRFPDFNKIIPMPESLNIRASSVGETALNLLFGHTERFDFLSLSEKQERIRELDADGLKEELEGAIIYWNNIKEYGYKTWYDWAIVNWGTKWNAYSCKKLSENSFQFDTAWSSPVNLIIKMSEMFPNVTINLTYADEDTSSNTGIIELKGGETISSFTPPTSSKEAYDIYFSLNPERKSDYILNGSTYEYVETEEQD